MFEYNDRHFTDICRGGDVRSRIMGLEQSRKDALRRFWLMLGGGILLAVAGILLLGAADWLVAGLILGFVVIVIALIAGLRPLRAAKEELKHPFLEALAREGGMEFLPSGFEPPVFGEARRVLFGGISSFSFTDMFHGTDAGGKRFAMYEGTLTRQQGKHSVTVFTGQIYAFQRGSPGGGETAIVPDKGLFNFIKPKGMERVRIESDPAFEKKFEIYSTQPASALGLAGTEARRRLLELRQSGRVFAWIGPDDVFVGVWGKNRFEAGSMFRSVAGEARVRRMFDEVCASLSVLRTLKAIFG